MIEFKDLLMVISLIITNGVALATYGAKVNMKISALERDLASTRDRLNDHSNSNWHDIKELKAAATKDRDDNKVDYANMMKEIAILNKNISDLRVDVVKAMGQKNVK